MQRRQRKWVKVKESASYCKVIVKERQMKIAENVRKKK